MPGMSYWERRAREREARWTKKCRDELEKELARYYASSLRSIEKDILALYGTFATDNGLDMQGARKLLHGQEFRQWRMGMQEYIDEIHRLEKAGDIAKSEGLMREINTLAMRSRISRLDKLRSETLQEIDRLGRKVETRMGSFLADAYRDNYYRNVFDIGKEAAFKGSFAKVDSKQVERVLGEPWSGKNYSQRIWKDMGKLEGTIQDVITQGVHRGVSSARMTKMVMERMNVSKSNAERLVRTEMCYVNNQAALDSIKDAGMLYFRFVAVMDSRTTPKCRGKDGEVFPVEDASPGANVPPLHPRCRSTIVASIDDGGSGIRGRRIARDKEGKNIRIPAEMRYQDWKAVYIDNSKTLAEWEKSLANGGANGTIGEKTKDFSDTANPFGFRDIQGAHSRKDDLAAVNPNFSTKSPEWTQNCQRCVSAYEARRRGYDVEALPRILNGTDRLPYMHDKQNGWTSVYGSPVLISCSSSTGIKTGEKVKLEMTQFGDGARAIVRVQWQKKYGGGGHVFIAEQVNGKTIFIDPQTGNENVEFYFSMAKKTETYLLRIDTLDFTDNIKKCCHNRGGGAP